MSESHWPEQIVCISR